MFRFNLAYRHGNGEVEGFSAFRFTKEAAEQACLAAIREKCQHTPTPFDPANVLRGFVGATAAERSQIKHDWKLYDKDGPGQSGLHGPTSKIGFLG